VKHGGVVEGASELGLGKKGGELDQGLGHREDGDAAMRDPVPRVQAAAAMTDDAGDPALGRSRDFGPRGSRPAETPQERGGASSEHGTIAAGKHRSQVVRLQTGRLVTDPIDARMYLDQSTLAKPQVDAVRTQFGLQ
jgi:hypothetical protein